MSTFDVVKCCDELWKAVDGKVFVMQRDCKLLVKGRSKSFTISHCPFCGKKIQVSNKQSL